MPQPTYRVVPYSPALKPQVIELQKHLWSTYASVNAAILEWKYENNPYLDDVLLYVALCDDRVVGMRGMFGGTWETGALGEQYPGLAAVDLHVRRRAVIGDDEDHVGGGWLG